jgi:hypothetical protein
VVVPAGYKWIAAEIERLDPETDYERIWALSATYWVDEFMMSFLYRRAMAELFWTEHGAVTGWPEDFAGMVAFLDEWESRHTEWTAEGAACTRAVLDQFAARWFPRPLHFLGRAMLTSFYGEPIRRVHHIDPPGPATVALMRAGLRSYVTAKERILPDPRRSTPQRHRRRNRGSASGVAAT